MRLFLGFMLSFLATQTAAFCGFYVARADGNLYNEASKVVYVRDGRKSVITMSSDYQGDPSEFAMLVPTPSVLRRNQVRTVKSATIDHLDAYSAPRLVEYPDHDPCEPIVMYSPVMVMEADGSPKRSRGPGAFGVTIKAQYAVGIYDILILSARESDGLVSWLKQEDYNIPDGAEDVLGDYIAMGMKFFVARINLGRHSAAEKADLEPLQISFRSDDFMLPLQLGKVNARDTQDVLVMTLTRTGRVEAANYANKRIPSDTEIPVFVKDVFPDFYRRMFVVANKPNTVMTEYAWDMAWCDPCAADPLSSDELKELGVSWLKRGDAPGQDVFVTRMHLQYEPDEFQQDLMMRETGDRENFQGRYIMNLPFEGKITCDEGVEYVRRKRRDMQAEAKTLQKLTGWSRASIDRNIRQSVPKVYQY